jgi:uncharacterized protein YndB with AHSA1/START domain
MSTLHHKIQINAPLEKIWAILTDLEQVQNYNPLVQSTRYISEHKTGVGSSRECDFIPKGRARERVTAVEEQKSISMEMYESDWPLEYMRWTNALSAKNGVTTMTAVTEYKLKFGVLGALLDNLMMKSKFKRTVDELLAGLKKYAESK